jgi:hypothetical protein
MHVRSHHLHRKDALIYRVQKFRSLTIYLNNLILYYWIFMWILIQKLLLWQFDLIKRLGKINNREIFHDWFWTRRSFLMATRIRYTCNLFISLQLRNFINFVTVWIFANGYVIIDGKTNFSVFEIDLNTFCIFPQEMFHFVITSEDSHVRERPFNLKGGGNNLIQSFCHIT